MQGIRTKDEDLEELQTMEQAVIKRSVSFIGRPARRWDANADIQHALKCLDVWASYRQSMAHGLPTVPTADAIAETVQPIFIIEGALDKDVLEVSRTMRSDGTWYQEPMLRAGQQCEYQERYQVSATGKLTSNQMVIALSVEAWVFNLPDLIEATLLRVHPRPGTGPYSRDEVSMGSMQRNRYRRAVHDLAAVLRG
jgi:hypothetical protein